MAEERAVPSLATRFVHVGRIPVAEGMLRSINVPVYRSAVFCHTAYGVEDRYSYSRLGNPTRTALEEALADLAAGTRAFAFASGMAAMDAVFSLFRRGDRLLVGRDLYGHTYRLLLDYVGRQGVEVTFVDTWDAGRLTTALEEPVRALFFETPTNPLGHVTDIRRAAELAHAHGALVIVDNTMLTPYGQRPLELGADVEVLSATKYLAGHNDVLAGVVIVRDPDLAAAIAEYQIIHGAVLSPDDAWLLLRGMKTLPLRLERQEANARALASYLQNHPNVEAVYYPGLAEHPGHRLQAKQASSFGATLSFTVRSILLVPEVLSRVRIITYAESLGGVESLITHPAAQTHRDIPPEERQARGLSDRLLRLSVGIEDVHDLQADLEQALVWP